MKNNMILMNNHVGNLSIKKKKKWKFQNTTRWKYCIRVL